VPTFDITFTFINVPVASQAIIQQAAQRWESVVVGDLSEQSGVGIKSQFSFASSSCTYPNRIDDFHLCVGYFTDGFTDGPGKTLGIGGPDRLRSSSPRTPFTGVISLDPADTLDFNTILHEMGHCKLVRSNIGQLWTHRQSIQRAISDLLGLSEHVALGKHFRCRGWDIITLTSQLYHVTGIGNLWGFFGLTSSFENGCIYNGKFANAEYRALTGCDNVPILPSGTICGHFAGM
jgi:hypothetical protein